MPYLIEVGKRCEVRQDGKEVSWRVLDMRGYSSLNFLRRACNIEVYLLERANLIVAPIE